MIDSSMALSFLMAVVPLLFVIGAVGSGFAPVIRVRLQSAVCTGALLAAGLAALVRYLIPDSRPAIWLSPAPVSLAMLVLVGFIALVIARYSTNYMAGETQLGRYYRRLNITLAAVALVVTSNHLLLLLAGWVAISLGLHRLLMFYPDRPRAALAAHKKFLLARVAEAALLAAALLLYAAHGTWYIDSIVAADKPVTLSLPTQLAVALLAITALIKCGQLPVHGWLIQVVEAPTPVSALLHAGIINLGGFLLILFAPLLAKAAPAQWLLLIVAGLTALLAGLISMTRVSEKVRLAWSTSAQMGLMLVECALGLYELALLHLVAHSCYKAYAFLSAGSAVEVNIQRRLSPAARPRTAEWLLALILAGSMVAVPATYLSPQGPYSPWALLAVALALLLAERSGSARRAALWPAVAVGALLIAAYGLQKTGAAWIAPEQPLAPHTMADLWFGTLILALFCGYLLLRYAPQTRVGRPLWHALYAGLYLDEWATRTTLAIWPARLPARINPKQTPTAPLSREILE